MRRNLQVDKTLVLFVFSCLITTLFLFSPLLLRVSIVHTAISHFLNIFGNSTYKSTYIETVGSILGTFLAITGALWTQSIFTKYEAKREIEKNALTIYYDLKTTTKHVLDIMNVVYPIAKRNTLPENERIINLFYREKEEHLFFFDSSWKQLIENIHMYLTGEEIWQAQTLYGKLSMINACLNDGSESSNKKAYTLMCSMVSITVTLNCPARYEIVIKEDISTLLVKLAKIAHVKAQNDFDGTKSNDIEKED